MTLRSPTSLFRPLSLQPFHFARNTVFHPKDTLIYPLKVPSTCLHLFSTNHPIDSTNRNLETESFESSPRQIFNFFKLSLLTIGSVTAAFFIREVYFDVIDSLFYRHFKAQLFPENSECHYKLGEYHYSNFNSQYSKHLDGLFHYFLSLKYSHDSIHPDACISIASQYGYNGSFQIDYEMYFRWLLFGIEKKNDDCLVLFFKMILSNPNMITQDLLNYYFHKTGLLDFENMLDRFEKDFKSISTSNSTKVSPEFINETATLTNLTDSAESIKSTESTDVTCIIKQNINTILNQLNKTASRGNLQAYLLLSDIYLGNYSTFFAPTKISFHKGISCLESILNSVVIFPYNKYMDQGNYIDSTAFNLSYWYKIDKRRHENPCQYPNHQREMLENFHVLRQLRRNSFTFVPSCQDNSNFFHVRYTSSILALVHVVLGRLLRFYSEENSLVPKPQPEKINQLIQTGLLCGHLESTFLYAKSLDDPVKQSRIVSKLAADSFQPAMDMFSGEMATRLI